MNALVPLAKEILEKQEFESTWNNYSCGGQFCYTYFFDRNYGWNVINLKFGYNQYGAYILKDPDTELKNGFNYSGGLIDIMSGFAYNFWPLGLDFEEGNQFKKRLVINIDGGININLCEIKTYGEPSFKVIYKDVIFKDVNKLIRLVFEPTVELVLECGLYVRGGTNICYLGPWTLEGYNADNITGEKVGKKRELQNTFSLEPIGSIGWDFSALLN